MFRLYYLCFCVPTSTVYLFVERLTYYEEHKYEQETDKTVILQTSTPEIFVIYFTDCLVTYSSTPTTYKSGCIGWNNKLQATTPASCFKILSNSCYVMLLHKKIEEEQLFTITEKMYCPTSLFTECIQKREIMPVVHSIKDLS